MKTVDKSNILVLGSSIYISVAIYTYCPDHLSSLKSTITLPSLPMYFCQLKNTLPSAEFPNPIPSTSPSVNAYSVTASGTATNLSPSPSPEDLWAVS